MSVRSKNGVRGRATFGFCARRCRTPEPSPKYFFNLTFSQFPVKALH